MEIGFWDTKDSILIRETKNQAENELASIPVLLFVCSSGYILFYCRIVFLELKNRLFCLVPRQYNLSDIEGKIIAIWHCFEPNNIHTHKKGGRSVWRREEGEKNWWQGVKIKCIDALLLFEKKERFVAHSHLCYWNNVILNIMALQ